MSTLLLSVLTSIPTDSVLAAVSSITTSALPQVSSPSFTSPFNIITPDIFANGIATLIGALVGAMLTYFLQRRFEYHKQRELALLAAHRLMFSLLQQINTVILIQRDQVYPELNNPGRFISIPALPPFDTKKNVLDLSELSFLLDDGEARQILYNFFIAQENYLEALNQWNLRSTFHLEHLQPALAASEIKNGSLITNEVIASALGQQIYSHAINSTDNCIMTLRRAFEKLSAVAATARPYLVKRFCTNEITEFDFPDTWGLSETGSHGAK